MTSAQTPALLLDLDDTLYDERDYVLSGFRAVASHIRADQPHLDRDALVNRMITELDTHRRGQIFDRLAAELELDRVAERVASWVEIYRGHDPNIALRPGVAEMLDRLKQTYDLAVVTDGLEIMQRRKIAALNIARWTRTVVYCWSLGAPKPRPEGYWEALRLLERSPEACIVIGDNPAHDMVAAKRLGARSIRVLTGRYVNTPDDPSAPATWRIDDLSALEATLNHAHPKDSPGVSL